MTTLKAFGLKLPLFPPLKGVRSYRTDILIALGLSIAIAIATYVGTYQIPDPILTDFYAQDVWFGSDIPTVFGNITSFDSDFGRNNKHPLFPLLVFPLVFGPATLFNLDLLTAVRLLIVATSIIWVASLYGLFRVMGCRQLDATLLSILGGASAASIFWLVVPESFPLASVTIILGLIFATLTQYRKFSLIWYVAINVITVSITITNAMVGMFTTFVNQSLKRIIQIGIAALLLSTALWMAQRILFKNSGFPFQPETFFGEKKFVTGPEHGSVLAAISSFFYQTMIMPAVQFLPMPGRPDWVKLDTNTLAPASAGWLATIAVVAWTSLLLLGLWGFLFTRKNNKLRIVLGLTFVAQMAMHSVYGTEETFIYSLHFAPLLLTLVAFSLLTKLRPVSLILVAVLILSAGVTNREQFNLVASNLWNYGTPSQQVEFQMQQRPGDPWMRGEGHVVLAATGSTEEDKAFHQPGGSFSPQPGSFGVSIWVMDAQGNLKSTSDTIPLAEIQQKFIGSPDAEVPRIETQTPYYKTRWQKSQSSRWQLALEPGSQTDVKPAVVIRSVGPAGGAIHSLDWNGQRLLINQRWSIKNLPAQAKVYLGSERSPNWIRDSSNVTQWEDEWGWGYARLEPNTSIPWQLEIEDLAPSADNLMLVDNTVEPVLDLPDTQFLDSFYAQIAHLKMGLVGNQTRPGDPISDPLPHLRDGAYQVVALAHTGHLELAKQLVSYFAATDFTNGLELSADIPAMGIWVLTTVADQVNQPGYDEQLWPDVRRKTELILDLIATNRPGYPVTSAAVRPFSEHPDFVKVDWTAGKMEATPGLIALDPAANFMSYRALLDAARMAERLKQVDFAEQWRSQATQLQTAWEDAFDSRFAGVDETYTTGLWPSWIAASNQEAFQQNLERRWQENNIESQAQNLFWGHPNTTVAEAHQWLYLKQPELVWSTLQTLWKHQASPGLYTWAAAHENDAPAHLSKWYRLRGWIDSTQVTPHHWTAAEMLLLQVDMLAYLEPNGDTTTLVLGAGIPKEWFKQPLSVKGLTVGDKQIDWSWDGKRVQVQTDSQNIDVKLGTAFPANTGVDVVPRTIS